MNVNIPIHRVKIPRIHALKPQNASQYEIILRLLIFIPNPASDACLEDGADLLAIADLFGNPEASGGCPHAPHFTTHSLGRGRDRKSREQAIIVKDEHLLPTYGYHNAFHHSDAGDMTKIAL
jgi:hypothetical protein